MSTYLREQSAGEILRGTVSIYLRNFLRLWGMYTLPILPFHVLKLKILHGQHAEYGYLVWLAIWLLVTPFGAAALTVGVSDICVGNRPSIARSLRRIFGTIFGKLILTNLFMLLIMAIAFVPAISVWNVPGVSASVVVWTIVVSSALVLLFQVWWMFVPTVVVLERTFGWTPLLRSSALGKGFYLRNLAIVLLLYITTFILGWVAFLTLQIQESNTLQILGAVLETALAPLPLIATVLLYYDLRARAEGYDLAMLGQDLRR
jgi:hypothetical protein